MNDSFLVAGRNGASSLHLANLRVSFAYTDEPAPAWRLLGAAQRAVLKKPLIGKPIVCIVHTCTMERENK